jgi:phosphotransferase system  glucose/maltose/N-acetylglucosamine-specific IIC component
MNLDKSIPRLLGVMFVVAAVLSLLSGLMLSSLGLALVGPPENISETMINISDNPTTTHVSIVVMLIEAVGIVLLAVLLYTTLKEQNRVIARWAFGSR